MIGRWIFSWFQSRPYREIALDSRHHLILRELLEKAERPSRWSGFKRRFR